MTLRLIGLVLLGAASVPTLAQAPAPAATSAPGSSATSEAKPKMVKKTICRRVDVEETTGSRLGSAPKVCTTVEVPARPGQGERGLR